MKVKDLIKYLKNLPQDSNVVLVNLDFDNEEGASVLEEKNLHFFPDDGDSNPFIGICYTPYKIEID